MAAKQLPIVAGRDIIYVCQNPYCQHREKEFTFPDRHSKYCSKCGCVSIKSTLVDSYNYMAYETTESNIPEEDTFDD